ncbi:MAG: BON domain-containing protein [Terriglobales bacterium]|jgi:BON domain-containing protein
MRIHSKSIFIALVTALLGLSIACSKTPKPADDAITKDVQTKVAADPDTKDSQVNVAVNDGKVTLTGKVSTPAVQQKVEEIARQEPGVAGVDDETTIDTGAQATPPPPPPPIVVPAGTVLTVRVGQALSSNNSHAGDSFPATLDKAVSVAGVTAIPARSRVSGTVVTAKAKGKIKGEGELSLALTSITVQGQTYNIKTSVLNKTIQGKGKRTAATTGGGAAGGALIGGLAGGGKGAAIGALVGGGAGLAGGAATGNQQIQIPVESVQSFRLSAPLTLPPPGQ